MRGIPLKIVIVGAGEVGYHIAGRLSLENKEVIVVDKDEAAIRRVAENIDVQTITGSGSDPSVLEDAGIKKADILLAVTDSDETNLVACLMADILSSGTKKLARLRGAGFDPYHDTLREHAPHIDTVINPEIEVVKTIEQLMRVPGAVDAGQFAQGRIKFVGIYLDNNSLLSGARLAELPKLIGGQRLLIAAIMRNEELIIPTGKDQLLPGDLIYFISEERHLLKTLSLFNKHAEPVKRVMIVGGGRIGFRLAIWLEREGLYCKIIDKNADRCAFLAEKLNKTVVLHGDGSDQNLLAEENIGDIDVVVTVTNDEETNILASLLAKRLGVGKTITQISKFSYFPLMTAIGIEQVVSPRLSAINTILQHIRRGKVLSAASLKGEQAEVLEVVALETSDIVSKPLNQVAFPKGAIVAGIIRKDHIIIPSGDSIIEPEDRIIIFAHREAISRVEKILSVKLEYF
jgi:trk system potassium uptake protein TrkA